jgi:nicotinate-nucleotide adenylyltransferase
MKVGLYFGSFNPIHVGHLIIANYMVDNSDLDQVWFVVSPHNPLKDKQSLLEDYHRLALVKEAIYDNPKLRASDIEFGLEQPNYTVKTLAILTEKHPDYEFSLLMGEDNLRTLDKWYNYEYLLKNYRIFVYPRVINIQEQENQDRTPNYLNQYPNIVLLQGVPVMNISSSYIRQAIENKKDVSYLLTPSVLKYVDEMGFYRKKDVNIR